MVNKAVRVTKANGAFVETQAKPFSASDLDADEVLIKNVAVASNPKDWKLALYGLYEGIEGNDVAGHIAAVGANVRHLSKDDRVGTYL
jgi:NADPH:quinone reductase-like Zn-dependent oxidoreductase